MLDRGFKNLHVFSSYRLKIPSSSWFRKSSSVNFLAFSWIILTFIGLEPAMADGEAKLDILSASPDWVGGVPDEPTEEWMISFGGRVYDKWYEAVGASEFPYESHPAYPEDGEFEGPNTWRCKECHGWDYQGADGDYARGKHFTGAPGLREMAGTSPEEIVSLLTKNTHAYTADMLPDIAMESVALFLTKGQHDTETYIDRATGDALGDPETGKKFYQNICATCHGFDGKAINFAEGEEDEEGDIEYIGTIAKNNPWETLHKIRNGQPGQPMPALRVLPIEDAVNILTYAQQLPTE